MKRIDISLLQINRSIYMKLGFIGALSFVIMAFNFTSSDQVDIEGGCIFVLEDMEEVDVIRTPKEKKRIPPPPSIEPTEDFVNDDNTPFMEDPLPEFIPNDIIAKPSDEPDDFPIIDVDTPEPVILIDEKEIDEFNDEPVIFAEYMPRFGNCDDFEMSKEEKKQCSHQALMDYFAEHIRYPSIARENGIQGTVVLRFVIDKDGSITQAKAAQEVSGGCTEEAIRVLKSMPKWKAGMQGGRKVKVYFTMPVKFRLEG